MCYLLSHAWWLVLHLTMSIAELLLALFSYMASPELQSCSVHIPKTHQILQAKLAQAAVASADHHNSSSSTKSSSLLELTSVPVGQWAPDGVAAQPWDLDPAEITICKRPDGSDWVLGVGSFGQVCCLLSCILACILSCIMQVCTFIQSLAHVTIAKA